MQELWDRIIIYIKILNAMYEARSELMQFGIAVSLGILIAAAGAWVIPLGVVLVLMRLVGSDPAEVEA